MQLSFLELTSKITTSVEKKTLGDWRKIIVGVPEGPLLFNIFLNDILFFLKGTNLANYADDSTLYAYNKNLETVFL